MKADGLFIFVMLIVFFVAWVISGGPDRAISKSGPFLTPVTRSGEESQGYRNTAPPNTTTASAYPRQIQGSGQTISSGASTTAVRKGITIERYTVGPANPNPNQEYITVRNSGTSSVTLTGWRLGSSVDTISIPSVVVTSGGTLTIITGRSSEFMGAHKGYCANDSQTCVFLNRNLELYGKTRETIKLMDESGSVIDSFSY